MANLISELIEIKSKILQNYSGDKDLTKRITEDNTNDYELNLIKESLYLDSDSLAKQWPERNHFSIISLNIQSLNAKFNKLTAFIRLMETLNVSFSAICLQETWVKDQNETELLKIDGYNCICQERVITEHGGLPIYLKEN